MIVRLISALKQSFIFNCNLSMNFLIKWFVMTKDGQQPVEQAVQQPDTPNLQANNHFLNETKS